MTRKHDGLPPGQTLINRLLRWGTDHPAITRNTPRMDLNSWCLIVDGEVNSPLKLTWEDMLKLPEVESMSDFHCVEGWSVLNCKWEGISFKCIVNLAKPKTNAKFVTFECADGYTTSLTLDELMEEDVLLAYKFDGKDLEEGLGWPLRLIIPDKYAYKNAMWIMRIRFTTKKEKGYWESRGYSDTADVWKNDRFST
jgi:DMSO/TMAO reductase YedYZ molybdopterin-dependent catalytic subunit